MFCKCGDPVTPASIALSEAARAPHRYCPACLAVWSQFRAEDRAGRAKRRGGTRTTEVLELFGEGKRPPEIARLTGVPRQRVWAILNGKKAA